MQWKWASSSVEAGSSGFLSISDSDRRVTAELGQESQASFCVEEWNSACLLSCSWVTGHLSSCVWNLLVFPDNAWVCQCPFVLCLHPQGCLQRGVRASGYYQEQTGKSGFSACGTTHVASLKFPRETSLILRCAGKVGNPFQTKQGIDPPVTIRRGEGAQMKCCWEPRCLPRVRLVCRENFGVASRVPRTISHFKMECGTFLEML